MCFGLYLFKHHLFQVQSYKIRCHPHILLFLFSYKEESEAEETDEDDIIEVGPDAVVDYEDDDRETIEKVCAYWFLVLLCIKDIYKINVNEELKELYVELIGSDI